MLSAIALENLQYFIGGLAFYGIVSIWHDLSTFRKNHKARKLERTFDRKYVRNSVVMMCSSMKNRPELWTANGNQFIYRLGHGDGERRFIITTDHKRIWDERFNYSELMLINQSLSTWHIWIDNYNQIEQDRDLIELFMEKK